jgi:hypothetical protein
MASRDNGKRKDRQRRLWRGDSHSGGANMFIYSLTPSTLSRVRDYGYVSNGAGRSVLAADFVSRVQRDRSGSAASEYLSLAAITRSSRDEKSQIL